MYFSSDYNKNMRHIDEAYNLKSFFEIDDKSERYLCAILEFIEFGNIKI